MKHILVTFFFLQIIFQSFLFGQNIKKHKDKVNGKSFTYYVMNPKLEVSGILLLLKGHGENPKSIFDKTSLPQIMAEKGFLTVVPELNNSLYADQVTISELDKIYRALSQEYDVSNLIIGGFSSGGAVGIGYAEYLLPNDSSTILKGVFAINPPLDLERLYASSESKINYECKGLIKKEGYSIKQELENSLGGSPETKPDQYLLNSSYSANNSNGGNAKYLKNIPIRLYTEPDLEFLRKSYCTDLQFEDMNAVDLQRLHKFLLEIGNDKAEYITTKGKGFHSWNILDASECSEWINRIVN